MNLYLIEQNAVNGYDTYDSAVVVAKSADEASVMYPGNENGTFSDYHKKYRCDDWVMDGSKVQVTYLGKATPSLNLPKVICASFNAG